ncbi:hypothetical protein GCM10010182_63030 [Actinomadura cremea]|nr:hypothetical protein GCM10010182_63030 [Actinomadura cremea]
MVPVDTDGPGRHPGFLFALVLDRVEARLHGPFGGGGEVGDGGLDLGGAHGRGPLAGIIPGVPSGCQAISINCEYKNAMLCA